MSINNPTQVHLGAYAQKSHAAALKAQATLQLAVFSARAFNRTGSSMDVGIVKKFSSAGVAIKAATYVALTTTFTDLTLPLTAATTIEPITAANNGFYIGTKEKSGLIGLNCTQAGATGVYTYKYYNGATFGTLTTIEVPDWTATGEKILAFLPPNDWEKGGNASLDSDYYYIQVIATTAPATALKVDEIWAGQLLDFVEGVADNGGLEIEFDVMHPFILAADEGLMPYFATANAANGMRIAYSTV